MIADLRLKTEDQLKEELATLKKAQFNLRFQKVSGQLKNTAEVRKTRRSVARVKTVLLERARTEKTEKKEE